MKLKKIASLALAGVMAVSMLAGCSGKGSDGNNSEVVVPSASSIVKAVNDGQKATNKVKVNFTSDSELDAALKRIADTYGISVDESKIEAALENLVDLKSEGTFMTKNDRYVDNKDDKGKTFVKVVIESYEAGNSEEYVLNKAAEAVNNEVAGLYTISDDGDNDGKPNVNGDDKYYSYSYEGTVGMISAKQVGGNTNYYVVYVIEQTITEKTA